MCDSINSKELVLFSVNVICHFFPFYLCYFCTLVTDFLSACMTFAVIHYFLPSFVAFRQFCPSFGHLLCHLSTFVAFW